MMKNDDPVMSHHGPADGTVFDVTEMSFVGTGAGVPIQKTNDAQKTRRDSLPRTETFFPLSPHFSFAHLGFSDFASASQRALHFHCLLAAFLSFFEFPIVIAAVCKVDDHQSETMSTEVGPTIRQRDSQSVHSRKCEMLLLLLIAGALSATSEHFQGRDAK